ncbi:DUF1775 domain-containing protein [Pseudosporangium ferrugineum]|uniref:LPXTG-motif cell wall-anchored protein/MYXO-CTERM domain-containing protein n=1 Tax=Pseudosporangium ferrugineum TaxID=439699 RepID=A0A2T0SHL7_9ACTN|nr:DUF1775 domain-containing protein [Pseudosporangium ferrugineum]PRY32902.1 LPXTG-motif cell wall-anchored protein/MYXO-CTERM domain-containing protein [Pseudosporangium ferrugineum]
MRNGVRSATVSVLAVLGVLAVGGPAAAHVEVSADKNQAGASDVTLTFSGEAENDAAGIRSERVVLPEGIAPDAVTLVKAPAGWTFARTADGFTVGGKALKVGTDAEWKVKIAKLPDGVTRLSFKTLETYGDGKVARWIEIQKEGAEEPENPAPLITLKPGPKPTATSATPTATATASSVPPAPAASSVPPTLAAEPVSDASDDSGSTWWIWVVAAVLIVAAGGFFLARRRRS